MTVRRSDGRTLDSARTSYDVRIHGIRSRADRRLPYQFRWRVGDKRHAKSFVTKALADTFRAQLMTAARAGEAFDVDAGLPSRLATAEPAGPTWFEHAVAYAEMKWPALAPNSRTSTAEALATVTPALVRTARGAPTAPQLRAALYGWAFVPSRRRQHPPAEVERALAWLQAASLPVTALDDAELVRKALNALAVKLDGQAAAATTVRRKRAVFYNCLGYAVERRLLTANPVDKVQWTAPQVPHTVDRRVVANPAQVRALLAAVGASGDRGQRLVAFFGCLYYAGTRPSEAADLRLGDCVLPEQGWGRLDLAAANPRAGSLWTDDGTPHQRRQLKWRAKKTTRPVPIPPELVRMLRAHLDSFGPAPDGRLFRATRGGQLVESAYLRAWHAARSEALTPAQAASPLAGRPYDLRHAAVSLWLNSGVPPTEVARRAGHSVATLLTIYASCIDGEELRANQRIDDALGGLDDTDRK